jgi:hypothetical protein
MLADQERAVALSAPKQAEKLLHDLNRTLSLDVVVSHVPVDASAPDSQLLTLENSITQEEHASILKKLSELVSLPQSQTEDTRLYLEQQVADIVGFPITTELRGFRLPHTVVQLKTQRAWLTEAQQATKDLSSKLTPRAPRSFFGPFRTSRMPDSDGKVIADYGISLPLHLTEKWQQDPFVTAEWFRYKQLLVVNPIEEVAVVCAVADLYGEPVVRYQGAVSPTVAREGRIWSLATQGKVLIYLLDTPKPVSFGVRSIAWKHNASS